MSENQPQIFTTGVNTVTTVDHLRWRIRNILVVQADKELLKEQTIEFETRKNSDHRLRWKMGLANSECGGYIIVHLRLIDINTANPTVLVNLKTSFIKRDGALIELGKSEKTLQPNEEMTSCALFNFNRPENYWLPCMDAEKTLELRFEIVTWQMTGLINQENVANEKRYKQIFISNLQNNFGKLLTDTSSSDLKIITSDGKEFPVHGVVLKAQCPVFESMLSPQSQFSESKDGIIRIDDVSGKTMEILLRYFYTGELLPSWRDADTVLEFTYSAGKYQLQDVLKMLDDLIGMKEDADSTCSISLLSLVNKLGLKKAEARLVQRIAKRTNAAKSSADVFSVYES